MSTETTKPEPIRPEIWHGLTDSSQRWEFYKAYGEVPLPSWETFTIKSMGFYREDMHKEPSSNRYAQNVRYVATQDESGTWRATRAFAYISDRQVRIHSYDTDELHADRLAFPIDPRMKKIDIDGATHIYENDDNTGWLFAHATPEDHNQRLLLAEATITTVFEQVLTDLNDNILIAMFNDNPSNQILAKMTVYTHVKDFKNDCAKMARYNESQLYIGQHVHEPEKYDLYSMTALALEMAKKKWKIEKAQEINQISDYVAGIEKRLASGPTYKTRWEADVFNSISTSASAESAEE